MIYVVIQEDRHINIQVSLFSTADKAIKFARAIYDDCVGDSAEYIDPEDRELNDDMRKIGWIFYACYSVEGDCVWSLPLEVDSMEQGQIA